MKLAVSFLSSNYSIIDTIKYIDNSNCDYIHVDIMDGLFVNNKSLSITDINTYLTNTKKKLDVHLMVNDPLSYLDVLSKTNCEYVTFHIELEQDIKSIINKIKSKGYKCGIAINPDTSIDKIKNYINDIDMVLVMSVVPGYGGQQFIMNSINKVNLIRNLRNDIIINIDGGINDKTIKLVNTDMVVVGSYICKSNNIDNKIDELRKEINI